MPSLYVPSLLWAELTRHLSIIKTLLDGSIDVVYLSLFECLLALLLEILESAPLFGLLCMAVKSRLSPHHPSHVSVKPWH